ncbi:hypothetical protein JJB09_08535 [Rhizobium sp. KVB221]|uniref:Uncharacterized protein n=1 Tax=Rhizobium setariae TaxID=2801340 RepID=A0A936YKR9_9HYPH|nr:hypothetical protein [Rhizobium setariae]MBL0372073.1 hypothetical protein [Rhizobium setariae]
MFYRFHRRMPHIRFCQTATRSRKEKTMTLSKKHVTVIWDFPVRLFNIGRKKLTKIIRERSDEDEGKWLNG